MLANLSFGRAELRFLGEDNDIEVDEPPAFLVQARKGLAEKQARIRPTISGIGVRVSIADVAQSRSPQQGIRDRVQNDIRIAMAGETARMGDRHTTQE